MSRHAGVGPPYAATAERNTASLSAGQRQSLIRNTHRPLCPQCRNLTHRVHRRLIDMVINLFSPIYRYRCTSMECDWEGNIRKRLLPLRSDTP